MVLVLSLFTLEVPVSASTLTKIPAENITLDTNSCAVLGVYAGNIPNPGLAGYDLDLDYDPEQIQIVSITRSAEYTAPIPEFENRELSPSAADSGHLTVVCARVDGLKGNYKLFNVKVQAKRSLTDVCPFTVAVKDFAGPDLTDLVPNLRATLIPDEPNVSADNQNDRIDGLVVGMEYSVDDSPFISFDGINLPNLSGDHTVFVRFSATGSTPPGAEKQLEFTGLEQASIPQAVAGTSIFDSSEADNQLSENIPIHLISATLDVKFYYTLGTAGNIPGDPAAEGLLYDDTNGILLPEGRCIIKAVAVKDGIANSETATFIFSNQVAPPYVLVNGTKYYASETTESISVPQDVPIYIGSEMSEDVNYYYTIDGNIPTTASNLYSENGITGLPLGMTNLKIIGTKNSLPDSKIVNFHLNITQTAVSNPPSESQITVINNPLGTDDTVIVQGLHGGDVVNVYADAAAQTILGTGTLPAAQTNGSEAVIIPQLGTAAGTIYVSITSPGMSESTRTAVAYPAEAIYGDINNDRIIDVNDVVLIMQEIVGNYSFNQSQEIVANVNGDNSIDVNDVVQIMQHIVGTLPKFPVEH